MDGLIVKEPFATLLVQGKKKFEYRSYPIPQKHIGNPVLILTPCSNGYRIAGQVTFYPSNQGDETWRVIDPLESTQLLSYKPKRGCIIWINNVQVVEH